MGLLDTIKSIFSGNQTKKMVDFYVEDNQCSKQMKLLFRKSYDIQKVYEKDREAAYEIKKVIVCDNCYNKIDLHLEFDKRYNIINQEIKSGKIISKEEFEENQLFN